jgi:hypothetical protein
MTIDLFDPSRATFSPCRRYRYTLSRSWGDKTNSVAFVMLNPSTADAEKDDPTIRKCITFAKTWGFTSLEVVNLYGWRSTDPKLLLDVEEPVGPDNDAAIAEVVGRAKRVVLAYGSKLVEYAPALWRSGLPGCFLAREGVVVGLVGRHASSKYGWLVLNQDGRPRHPLYVPGATLFKSYPDRT